MGPAVDAATCTEVERDARRGIRFRGTRGWCLLLVLAALALLLCVPSAQAAATMYGRVTDRAGAGLSGITVNLTWEGFSAPLSGSKSTVTDGGGYYSVLVDTIDTSYTHGAMTASDPLGVYSSESWSWDYSIFPYGWEWDPVLHLKQPAGTISGSVTAGGVPLQAATVQVRRSTWMDAGDYVAAATTDADGHYVVQGLEPDVDYYVRFVHPDWAARWWGAIGYSDPQPVVLPTGEGVGEIDASLEPGGSLTGRLLAAKGDGAKGVTVQAYFAYMGTWTRFEQQAVTDNHGRFRMDSLPVGDYHLRCSDPQGRYATEWWAGHQSETMAEFISVSAGAASEMGDFRLTNAGRITGTVSGIRGGLENVQIQAILLDPETVWLPVAVTHPSANGSYEFTGLYPGTYAVEFWDLTVTYQTQYYDGLDYFDFSQTEGLTVGAGHTVRKINARLIAIASIGGRVTDSTGAGIPGVYAFAWSVPDMSNMGTGYTDDTGAYQISLNPGTYVIQYSPPPPYLEEWWNDKPSEVLADEVVLGSEEMRTGVDAVLGKGGTISGTVTNADGQGLAGVSVKLRWQSDGVWHTRWTSTMESGAYEFYPLKDGTYYVGFTPSAPYKAEWWDDRPTRLQADPIVIAGGADRTGIDAVMGKGGSISGRLTDLTGQPVTTDSEIYLYRWKSDGPQWVGWTSPAPDGSYTFGGLTPGRYAVEFYAYPYLGEWYDDALSWEQATPITVGRDEAVSGIDAVMTRGSTISGIVIGAEGAGIDGVQVTAYRYDPDSDYWWDVTTVRTARDGSYEVPRLPGGTYRVRFLGTGEYFGEWYDNARTEGAATSIEVPRDTTVTGIDAQLERGGVISGDVSGPDGEAVGGVTIAAYQENGHGGWRRIGLASSDATGNYTLSRLPEGDYVVGFSDPDGRYLGEYWDDVRSRDEASPVAVQWDETVMGIDAALARASHIGGKVTDETGDAATTVRVTAYRPDGDGGWDYVDDASADASGRYDIGGLPAGTYFVRFVDPKHKLAGECWDAARRLVDANPVVVGDGETVGGIDAVLGAADQISGTVTGADGPLDQVHVVAYANVSGERWDYVADATSNAAGQYVIDGLATGDYRVKFMDELAPWWWWPPGQNRDVGPYLDEWYDDSPGFAGASEVALSPGEATSGIDAVLSLAGHISGTVKNGQDELLRDIAIDVYKHESGGWQYVDEVSTNATGAYDVGSLRTGEYKVKFSPQYYMDYSAEWFNDKATMADADVVAVTTGATTSGVDAVLTAVGEITGTVKGPDDQLLPNVSVYAMRPAHDGSWEYIRDATTAADGTYHLRVPVGDYTVDFYPSDTSLAEVYWPDAPIPEDAQVVTVRAGEVTGGIDQKIPQAGAIGGSVTDPNGDPVSNVEVALYVQRGDGSWVQHQGAASTDDFGAYAIERLAPATYRIGFRPQCQGYAPQFWDGSPAFAGASDIPIVAGEKRQDVDAQLGVGTSLKGSVTDSAGKGAVDVHVMAYRNDGGGWDYAGDVTTDATGGYLMKHLTAGTYTVEFVDDVHTPSRYVTEWYDDAATLDAATGVDVADGDSAVVDATLTHRAEITLLTSPTHPDDTVWYHTRDVTFEWSVTDAAGVAGYGYVLDHDPGTPAPKAVIGQGQSTTYENVGDGVWYFHVRGAVADRHWYFDRWLASWSPTRHFAVHIDDTPPTTRAHGADGWHYGPVHVTLAPEDPASGMTGGAAKTEYKVDGATVWLEGTDAFVPARLTGEDDGLHTVTFRSTDAAGNVEDEQSVDVLIDTVAPTITDDAGTGWYAPGWTLRLTPDDERSGVAETEFSIDGGVWRSGTDHVFDWPAKRHDKAKTHTVDYRTFDQAGNVAMGSCIVQLDGRAPDTTADTDGLPHSTDTLVNLTACDEHSGVASTWYSLDGSPAVEGAVVLVAALGDHTGDGLHVIVFGSVDNVGNQEAPHTCTVLIDTSGGG